MKTLMNQIGTPTLEYIVSLLLDDWDLELHSWEFVRTGLTERKNDEEYDDEGPRTQRAWEAAKPFGCHDIAGALYEGGDVGGLSLVSRRKGIFPKAFIPCFDAAPDATVEDVRRMAQELKLSGVVAATGASYHFIADRVVVGDQARLHAYLNLLRHDEAVDQKWIDFCFKRGTMVLRTTRSPDRPEPRIVAYV